MSEQIGGYRAPWGYLRLVQRDGLLISVQAADTALAPLTGRWCDWLDAYFAGCAQPSGHPVACGSDFSQRVWAAIAAIPYGQVASYAEIAQRVWAAIAAIPYGQVASYAEIARQLGTSARAVGGACARNPIPLLVPCHRVVAAHALGGFSLRGAAHPLMIKQWLLTHERRTRAD